MNGRLLLLGIVLTFAVLVAINFDSMYVYFAYTVPMKTAVFEPKMAHYDYVPTNGSFISMEKISLQDDGSIQVEFGQNDYKIYSRHTSPSIYEPIPEFSYADTFQINDTFAVLCSKQSGSDSVGLGIIKYLGPVHIDNETLLALWHESASTSSDMSCSYPQIIEHSVNLWDFEPDMINDSDYAGR